MEFIRTVFNDVCENYTKQDMETATSASLLWTKIYLVFALYIMYNDVY